MADDGPERSDRAAGGGTGVRIMLRPITIPLPMRFLGLAGASALLAGLQLGWLPVRQSHQPGIAIVLVALPLQLIASVMGYLARSAAAATGLAPRPSPG